MRLCKLENIPNLLTALRVFLAAVHFVLFSCYLAARAKGVSRLGEAVYFDSFLGNIFRDWDLLILNTTFGIYLAAVLTDWLDGTLARKWNVVSVFGRIADPFADKIIISGSFVLFLPLGSDVLPIEPWMVVVMLAREYLVTGIRGYAESQGIEFSASIWGKLKMIFQSFCVGCLLFYLANQPYAPKNSGIVLSILVWLTLLSTIGSGIVYIQQASKLFVSPEPASTEQQVTQKSQASSDA